MDDNSPVLPSRCEATPEEQSRSKREELLLLSEMSGRSRELFEECLSTETSETIAKIRDMIIQAPDKAMVKSNLFMAVDSLLLQRKKGNNSITCGVESGIQGGFHAGYNGLKVAEVKDDNGGFRVTGDYGFMREEEGKHPSIGEIDNGLGDKKCGVGVFHEANIPVETAKQTCSVHPCANLEDAFCVGHTLCPRRDDMRGHTFKGVDPPVTLTAALQKRATHNANPNPDIPSVPMQFQNNFKNATTEFIPSVPLHGLINDYCATSASKPYDATDDDLIGTNRDSCDLGNTNNGSGYVEGGSSSITTKCEPHISKKEGLVKKESDVTLLGDLQKHLSKGGKNILLHKFHACISDRAPDTTSTQDVEDLTDITEDGQDHSVFPGKNEATSVKKNFVQALTSDGNAKVKVDFAPTKPIQIPFYPENLKKQEVRIKSETLKKGADQWTNCVVGKFIVRRPPSNLIRSRVMALWQKKGLISVMEQKDEFIFKFQTADQRNHILESRVWVIAGQQMIISDWLEENAYITSHFTKFPIWVKLLKVPPICWTAEGIGQIASTIGKPLVIDEITASRKYMNYARVKIEVEAGVIKPRVIKVDLADNVSHEVVVHYTACAPSCTECKVFGHYTSNCTKKSLEGEGLKDAEKRNLESKDNGGKREEEEEINIRNDDTNQEDTSTDLRKKEDEAQVEATIDRHQEMAHCGESSRLNEDANTQDNSGEENTSPINHVHPKIVGLSKSKKKKLKKGKHGKGVGDNGRSPD